MKYSYEVRSCGLSNVKSVYALDDVIDYYDLTTVFSGTLHYCINNHDYLLKKGDTILIPPGSYRKRFSDSNPAHYFSLNYFSDGSEEKSIPLFIPNCSSALRDTVIFCNKILCNHPNPLVGQKRSLAIHLLILSLKEEVENNYLSPHVRSIVQYISDHFTEHLSLEDIANSVFLTVPYCCHLVKQELGITIYEIILNERIHLAQNYLRSGEFPLKEIPYLCGFNDYSHFYKCFKKYTGISPSKFK